MTATRLAAFALALAPLASPVWAADATPEQAQALERSLREWLATTLGPSAQIPQRLVQITADGDHYDVAVPLGNTADAPELTATARHLEGTKWSIEDITWPSPAQFTINMPQVNRSGDQSQPAVGPVTYNLTLGEQSGRVTLDTSQATPTTMNSNVQNMDLRVSGAQLQQSSHVERATSTAVVSPVRNGRVDVTSDATIEGYQISSQAGDQALQIAMGRLRMTNELTGVSQDRVVQILQTVTKAMARAGNKGAQGGADSGPPLDPASTRALLQVVADTAGAISITESLERLSWTYGMYSGTLGLGRFGLAARNEAGMLRGEMELGMEALGLPGLPLGEMASLIPTKLTLRPSVSGVAVADLLRLSNASSEGRQPSPEDLQALFSHGGITAGLDSFSIDVAGSNFAGMGKLVFAGPDSFTGTAQITATNLDLLQQRVASMPPIAAQALPVFILAKGIGRTVGNQMVWDITYRNGAVLVNGQDLSAMAGGGGGGGQNRQQQQPRPNRPRQQ